MKKILTLITVMAVMFASSFNADAQFSRIRFGVAGGFTSSSTNIKNVDTKSVSLYHAGVTMKIPLLLGFAIQPSVMYQVKGATLESAMQGTANEALGSLQTKVGYVEVPVQVQWGPDLIVFRPYVFAEPFIGWRVNQSASIKSVAGDIVANGNVEKTFSDQLQKMEYGLALGAGIEFWKLQLSAKYFWNFGNMYGESQSFKDAISKLPGEAKDAITSGKSFNGITFTLALLF